MDRNPRPDVQKCRLAPRRRRQTGLENDNAAQNDQLIQVTRLVLRSDLLPTMLDVYAFAEPTRLLKTTPTTPPTP